MKHIPLLVTLTMVWQFRKGMHTHTHTHTPFNGHFPDECPRFNSRLPLDNKRCWSEFYDTYDRKDIWSV